MSTFSSDRVGETIIPDLTKRFRRGYIDYFDRKNGTDRPVEEIPTRSIIPLDQFEGLMKLLDDIVLFSAATPELATKFQGLWNRLDLPDKDDKDRIECTRMGLISFESYIKVFIYLLCGNGDLLRQIDAEKRGLGYILNNLSRPRTGNRVCSTPGTRVCSTRCAATGTESRTPRATPTRKKATS